MQPRARPLAVAVAAILVAGCADAGASRGGGAAGLLTAIDSTADSIIARVDGDVPASSVRRLEQEMLVAPAMDDTSLFGSIYEFDVDAANRLWVFDGSSSSIFLFGSDGALIRRIGREGGGPGEFKQDNGMIALADTGLAVLDYENARLSFFSAAGDFQTSWRVPTGFFTTSGLVTDRSGSFFIRRPVTEPREGEILGRMGLVRVLEDGTLRDSLAPPDLDVPREVYVAVSPDGRGRSSTASGFAPNYYWAWHPDGYFVVGHGGKYEVILARTQGKPVAIRRSMTPVPVGDEERTLAQERITWSMRRTNPAWTWQGPAIPTTKAPLTQLLVSRDGRIWARVATPSERIPDAELDPPRENGPPPNRFRSPAVWEVFAPDGTFLGRIAFPPRTTLVEADGDMVWATTRDENDLPGVARYRIQPGLAR